MGTIAYLYLDESGSFGTQDRVAVVAGYRSALDEAQAGAFVRASMADCAREAGIDPAMTGHLTELRTSARRDADLRERIDVYLDLLWKRWSAPAARMIPVSIIYRHGKEIADSDSLYLDMLAELCSIQILLDPEVESWVFLPALRVRERFHGKVVQGEDPCFPKEEYAAVLSQKIRDALIPLGRSGAGFEIRPRSARTMEFLVAADYIANRSYHDWIVQRKPESEGGPVPLPAGAGEFHFATLGLMENVLVSLDNAQWDNALVSLLRASAALGGSSATPESLFPQVWERIQSEFLEDDAPLDSIPGFAESLAEASCKSGRRLGYAAGVAVISRLLDLHPDRLEAAAARFMLAVTGAELSLRGADGRGLQEFLRSAESLENDADEHPACVDAAIRFVLLQSLCALERADPDLSRCLAQDALAMAEAQTAAAALVPGMGSDPRSRLLPVVLRIRAVVESRAAFLAGDGAGATKAMDLALAALEAAATPLERCLAQADARLAILRARLCGAVLDGRTTTVFDTDMELPRGKDDSAFLALCAAAWAGRLWALMQPGTAGTSGRACPACERLAAIRETAPVTDFERLLAFAVPGASAATLPAGTMSAAEDVASAPLQKRIAGSLGLPGHISSLSGAVAAAANALGRTEEPRWLALGLLAGSARLGAAVQTSHASGEAGRAPAGFAKLTHALDADLRLCLSTLMNTPGPGFCLALLDLCSASWEMPG